MQNRRDFIKRSSLLGLSALSMGTGFPSLAKSTAIDGFYQQHWFHKTSFDIKNDLEFAKTQGKILTLLWEQQGCHYCKKMHDVVFQNREIVDLISQHFVVVQMDMWGDREFSALYGKQMKEAALARSYLVRGTPSAIFFDEFGEVVFQMPGYAEPPVFLGVFRYVQEKGYDRKSFTDWYKSQG
ncbi:MAG: thioredoxin fold domain-containing protein [Rhizobiaceae bacterium]|nr:thioredoxin fold domain-containing protein [Rhizobiaceae bacterium]